MMVVRSDNAIAATSTTQEFWEGLKLRVLVTGSHGFIGSQLVKRLEERGDEVLMYDLKAPLEARFGDYFPEVEEIYNLACVNQEESELDPLESRFTNAYLPLWMVSEAKRMGARFIHTSTASVYGNAYPIPTPKGVALDPRTVYARDKLKGERLIASEEYPAAVFRLSNVYGPGQTTENPYCGVVAKFLEAAIAGEPLKIIGNGSQTRDFTYVEDVIDHLVNPELTGLFNLSYGEEISILELAYQVVYLLGIKDEIPWDLEVPERSVDGIQRRCLIPDLECPTDLPTGLQKTLESLYAHRKV